MFVSARYLWLGPYWLVLFLVVVADRFMVDLGSLSDGDETPRIMHNKFLRQQMKWQMASVIEED